MFAQAYGLHAWKSVREFGGNYPWYFPALHCAVLLPTLTCQGLEAALGLSVLCLWTYIHTVTTQSAPSPFPSAPSGSERWRGQLRIPRAQVSSTSGVCVCRAPGSREERDPGPLAGRCREVEGKAFPGDKVRKGGSFSQPCLPRSLEEPDWWDRLGLLCRWL